MRTKEIFTTLFLSGAAFALGATSGCGSDDKETGQGAGGLTGTGGGAATIDCTTPAGIAECRKRAFAEGSCEEVGGCACDNCCQFLQDCEEDEQCVAIRKCGQETGCRGIPCYQDSTCKGVIDANGGPTGIGTGIATALSACLAGDPAATPPKPVHCPVTMCP